MYSYSMRNLDFLFGLLIITRRPSLPSIAISPQLYGELSAPSSVSGHPSSMKQASVCRENKVFHLDKQPLHPNPTWFTRTQALFVLCTSVSPIYSKATS